MFDSNTYQLSLVEKLSFLRTAGSPQEKEAANILMDEIAAAGGNGELHEFTIPSYEIDKCSFKVTAPFEKEYEVIAYGRSGSLPEGGATLKLIYAERGVEEDFIGITDLSDTAVIIDALNIEAYELLCSRKAAAFITVSGKYYQDLDAASAYSRAMRPNFLEKGCIPGFMISAKDATELVGLGANEVHLELLSRDLDLTSQNVLAVIPGTACPEESIVLTAHYDSVPVGTGSWDNATGSATLMYIYRHFLHNPPRRTMRFIWCGAEEVGLLGSKAYVEQKPELVSQIKFCFNFDMCGTILGSNRITVTGGEDLKTFIDQFCKEDGYSASINVRVHSSDSAPFCDKGIPALGLSRGSQTAEIHTKYDLLPTLGAKQLKANGDFAIRVISRVTNSVILPVKTGMPENVLKMLDDYFKRSKKSAPAR